VRVLVFAYSEIGCAGLEHLLAAKEDIAAVVTHRDDPREERWFRSVADVARNAGLPVVLGENLDREAVIQLAAKAAPDAILSLYYRSLLPVQALATAPRGAFNLHGSLLPRLRGRAPLHWALIEAEARTGVTLHHMIARADAGDIVAQRAFDIGPRDTALDLHRRAVAEAMLLLAETWPQIQQGSAPRTPQIESLATYRGRRTPEDGWIDWSQPARRIDGLVRAVAPPFPGAFTRVHGRRLAVWEGRPDESAAAAAGATPGLHVGGGIVATGAGAYRIARCAFLDGADGVAGAAHPVEPASLPANCRLDGPSRARPSEPAAPVRRPA